MEIFLDAQMLIASDNIAGVISVATTYSENFAISKAVNPVPVAISIANLYLDPEAYSETTFRDSPPRWHTPRSYHSVGNTKCFRKC